ncbi:MAG: indole-3-glycerol-phosphate synthase [Robiginitomaculum sp.]|nr:MAG: indole-3-glycerol-phosphate synthase [Robiginitomaculum sp.]
MADILQKIARYKRKEVKALKAKTSHAELEALAKQQSTPRGFLTALRTTAHHGPALIAEIKKASPSKGLIRADFRPADFAQAYQAGGAACLSVLTDGPSFQGKMAFMQQARAACSLPVLRKDFMVDPYQIIESRAHGADAILIIMAMIDNRLAKSLLREATRLGMDALVETHDVSEMRRAIAIGATLIGVNNRNLKTFETSLDTFIQMVPHAPNKAFLVAESGIFTPDHILHQTRHGAQAFLVGESLMRQDDVQRATEVLLGKHAP